MVLALALVMVWWAIRTKTSKTVAYVDCHKTCGNAVNCGLYNGCIGYVYERKVRR